MALDQEIRELEKRFADAPESRLFLPLADALSRAGELERAVEICRQGLESYPDFTSARVLLGQCLAGLGRYGQARETLESVLAEDESNLEVLKALAQIAAQEGEAARAREFYGRALAVEPEDESLTEALSALEEAGDAMPPEEPALPEAGGAGEVFITHTLGDLYRLQGHYQRAYEVYSRLIESCPQDSALQDKLHEVATRLPGVRAKAEPVKAAEKAPVVALPEPALVESVAAPEEMVAVPAERETVAEEPVAWETDGDDETAMTRRIDHIFALVLDDLAQPSRVAASVEGSGAGSFVNMFERWIKGLKLLEAE